MMKLLFLILSLLHLTASFPAGHNVCFFSRFGFVSALRHPLFISFKWRKPILKIWAPTCAQLQPTM